MEVRANRTIAAAPDEIFEFLANPDRHWQLLGRRLEPLRSYDGERSQVRLRGPLGIRRTLWIRMAVSRPPHELVGRVEAAGGATIGTVRWEIRPLGDGSDATHRSSGAAAAPSQASASPGAAAARTHATAPQGVPISTVELTARTDVAGWLDRLLLASGGRHWLRRSLDVALVSLVSRVGQG